MRMKKVCKRTENPIAIGDFFPLISLSIAIHVCEMTR